MTKNRTFRFCRVLFKESVYRFANMHLCDHDICILFVNIEYWAQFEPEKKHASCRAFYNPFNKYYLLSLFQWRRISFQLQMLHEHSQYVHSHIPFSLFSFFSHFCFIHFSIFDINEMIDTFDSLAVMIVAFRMVFYLLLGKMAIFKINKHSSQLIKFDNKCLQSK